MGNEQSDVHAKSEEGLDARLKADRLINRGPIMMIGLTLVLGVIGVVTFSLISKGFVYEILTGTLSNVVG